MRSLSAEKTESAALQFRSTSGSLSCIRSMGIAVPVPVPVVVLSVVGSILRQSTSVNGRGLTPGTDVHKYSTCTTHTHGLELADHMESITSHWGREKGKRRWEWRWHCKNFKRTNKLNKKTESESTEGCVGVLWWKLPGQQQQCTKLFRDSHKQVQENNVRGCRAVVTDWYCNNTEYTCTYTRVHVHVYSRTCTAVPHASSYGLRVHVCMYVCVLFNTGIIILFVDCNTYSVLYPYSSTRVPYFNTHVRTRIVGSYCNMPY